MSFENDVFISYAHIDNLPLESGQQGWVAALHRALELRVAQLLGKKPRIWRDPNLSGNESFADRLSSELPKAALLVSILSPRYLRSDWCLRELTEFLATSEHQTATPATDKNRIFKILKTPTALEEQPPELQKMLGYEFFQIDSETGRPHEIDPVMDPDTKRQYWAMVNDLAYDISKMLELFEEVESGGAGQVTAAGGEKECIFVGIVTHDLKEARDAVTRDLKLRGFRVLPEEPLPLYHQDDLVAAVRAQLAASRMAVHLVGEGYGIVPEGTTDSAAMIELEAAAERQADEQSFVQLVWMPSDLESEDQRQADLIRLLKIKTIAAGSELFRSSLESLKTEIRLRLEPPEEQEEKPEEAAAGDDEDDDYVRLYLICDERDEEATAPLEDYLWDQENFEIILPAFEGSEKEVRLDHQDKLVSADAVVLYYGAGKDLWLSRKVSEIRKSPGFGRKKAWLTKPVVYVAPPLTPRKKRFRSREASVVVQGGESFSGDELEPFVHRCKAAKARPA